MTRAISPSLSLLAILLVTGAAWAGSGPMPVSPGSAGGFVAIGTPCPTFSWTAVEGATGYELVVYAAPAEGGPGVEQAPEVGEAPVVRTRVAGQGLAWTPPSESCLELAGSYVWSVRALGEAGAGEWSEGMLFKVEVSPVVAELGDALERALLRYLDERGIRLEANGALAGLIAEEMGRPETAPAVPPALVQPGERMVSLGGTLMPESEALARDPVLSLDDWELELIETDTGVGDWVQMVLSVPANTLDWAFAANASTGVLVLNGPPLGADAMSFDPSDGSTKIERLEVVNQLLLRPDDSPAVFCNSAADEGSLYWDDSLGQLCGCDGVSWKRVRDGTAC